MTQPGVYTAIYENGAFVRWDYHPHDDPNDNGISIINCPYLPSFFAKKTVNDPFVLEEVDE